MTSGARLAKLAPSALDDEQRALYDAIAGGPRAQGPQLFPLADQEGWLEGPFNAFLLQPRLGRPCRRSAPRCATTPGSMTGAGRSRSSSSRLTGGRTSSGMPMRRSARAAGLSDTELADVRDGGHGVLTGREAVVARTARALAARGDLDDAEYREAVGQVGAAGLFELLTLVGYYAALALQLRVFRVPAPEGVSRRPRALSTSP